VLKSTGLSHDRQTQAFVVANAAPAEAQSDGCFLSNRPEVAALGLNKCMPWMRREPQPGRCLRPLRTNSLTAVAVYFANSQIGAEEAWKVVPDLTWNFSTESGDLLNTHNLHIS
jgi:hypothetical protein